MLQILLTGACGKMGHVIADCISKDKDTAVFCGVDRMETVSAFPIYHSFDSIKGKPDVIIDFSNVSLLDELLKYALSNRIPLVIATTGFDEKQKKKIADAAEKIPLFFTYNMSLGVNLICSLAKKAAAVLGNQFDVEIIEKHHNQKVDAPSGTALMLANAINSEFDDRKYYEYDRHSKRQKRSENEIGIHSVRGGTIVGEHEVIFAGRDEVITLSHSAGSKEIFAVGALRAAKFLADKPAGLYDMSDVVRIE